MREFLGFPLTEELLGANDTRDCLREIRFIASPNFDERPAEYRDSQHLPSSRSIEHIARYSDIAPGRKTEPGLCFDWERYLAPSQPRVKPYPNLAQFLG